MTATGRVLTCSRPRKAEVLNVLCDAFEHYPAMRYLLGSAGPDHYGNLRLFMDFVCESRLDRGIPMYAVEAGGCLVAAALVSPPGGGSMSAALERRYTALIERLGAEADLRMERLEQACDEADPGHVSHYLGTIGVARDHQGRGAGRQLIEAIKDQVRRHADSQGLLLNTETEHNLGFYRRLGFDVVGEADADQLHTWALFWPKDHSD